MGVTRSYQSPAIEVSFYLLATEEAKEKGFSARKGKHDE